MGPLIVALAMIAFGAGWRRWMYQRSTHHPLRMAFSATATGVFFAATGLAGYTVSRHERFVTHATWVDHVIWRQVGLGALAGFVAVLLWHRALSGR